MASAAEVTSDSFSEGTTKKLAPPRPSYESDTFASQESDARRSPRKTSKLAVPIALGLLGVLGGLSFVAYRGRAPVAAGGAAALTTMATTTAAATVATTVAEPVVAVAPSSEPAASASVTAVPGTVATSVAPAVTPGKAGPNGAHRVKGAGSNVTGSGTAVAAPAVPVAPAPAKAVPSAKDESFLRTNTF